MNLYLAPMEGVIDHTMRELLTDIGGYDRCVTEFVRVTTHPVPAKVFRRYCPELETGGRTRAGVPVYIQLLGGDSEILATSAAIAAAAGAPGIDINFGCPAKLVNRHDGGSVLLKEPSRIRQIVTAVRQAVDPTIPVCAKIRLGFDNTDLLAEVIDAVDHAGASELCIHARTKTDGYRPPARWSQIALAGYHGNMTLVVNGEIWNINDANCARVESGCQHLMIGRGGLAFPDLAQAIRAQSMGDDNYTPLTFAEIAARVDIFFHRQDSSIAKYVGNRTKQWLGYLRMHYPEADDLFKEIRQLHDRDAISAAINRHRRISETTCTDSQPIAKLTMRHLSEVA